MAIVDRRIRFGSYARLEVRPVGQLRTTVERDATTGEVGQGLKCVHKAVHDRSRLPIVVAQKDRKAAGTFNE
ncbi:hypothetical protein AT5A_19176 [Agrobacterium tumefaciens 5A]|nr:hypothetical protein AT5A_19176 [Agrobacterium tumefaciens 5A]